MHKLTRFSCLLTLIVTLSGCVSWMLRSEYDDSELVIQTLNLFNQRQNSNIEGKHWKGDWIFRRGRLELVDAELRSTRPDLVFFQEMLAKRGSLTDSDRRILAKGGLYGYDWDTKTVEYFSDTGEEQYHGLAVGLPLQVNQGSFFRDAIWKFGSDGYLTFTLIKTDEQPLAAFNVQMPSEVKEIFTGYSFVVDRITEVLQVLQLCKKRLIVAGYIPGNPLSSSYANFVSQLELKNTGEGFCSVSSDCFTGTPHNEIFMATVLSKQPSQFDKIFVHSSSFVTSGSLVLNKPGLRSENFSYYGLTRLWPSQRFGWLTSVRFSKCLLPRLK